MSTDTPATGLEPAAAALLAAGATAAGPCPSDPAGVAAWERQVAERALGLARLVPAVTERMARIAGAKPVTGVIISVRDVSGRAVITTRPTMGGRDTEDFRTPWLNEPAGASMAALARSLVGRHVRLGKRLEATRDGQKKVGMCEWVEDLGPDPDAPAARGPAAAPAPPADDPFRPFDESNMTLAGPSWARKFAVAMTASGWDPKVAEAVVHYATGGVTRDARSVLRTQVSLVAGTHAALDAGKLTTAKDDRGRTILVEVGRATGGAAA